MEPVYRLRAELGLPRGEQPLLAGQHSPKLVLALFSSVLGKPQPDWPREHARHRLPVLRSPGFFW